MIMIVSPLLGLLGIALSGGQLARLGTLRLRGVWTVWLSIALQVLISSQGRHMPGTIAEALHLASYALSATFIWFNRSLPGARIVALGGALNLAAIITNGGTMPATQWAWRTSGLGAIAPGQFENSAVSDSSAVWFFGDVFAIPSGLPFANVFSLGDVVLVGGFVVLAHRVCRPPRSTTVEVTRTAMPAPQRSVTVGG